MSAVYHEIRQTKPFRSLEEEVYIAIRLTSQVMDQPWARYLRKTEGISPSQYNLLRILREAGADGRAMREIADRMINRDPDVTRLADGVVKLRLARRMRDTEDRRVVKLSIAEKGVEMLKQTLGGLGPKRLRMLRDLLGEARTGFRPFPDPAGSK
jgi:DNA-binding MarR family transcriptional regulator